MINPLWILLVLLTEHPTVKRSTLWVRLKPELMKTFIVLMQQQRHRHLHSPALLPFFFFPQPPALTLSVSTSFLSLWFSECRSLMRCSAWPSWASSSASSSLLPSWNSSSSSRASWQLQSRETADVRFLNLYFICSISTQTLLISAVCLTWGSANSDVVITFTTAAANRINQIKATDWGANTRTLKSCSD